ncbi:hypothetical protein IJ670_03295, partial [bacterium]|nr:hypothetical protein [bacterium]
KKNSSNSDATSIQAKFRAILNQEYLNSIKTDNYTPTENDKKLLMEAKKRYIALEKEAGLVQSYDRGLGFPHVVDRTLELIDLYI